MILAQKLETGEVRYITVLAYDREYFTPLLKTFYSIESRVTALLDLGNLYQLGPSPYVKYCFDGSDEVHCQSLIRDHKNSRGVNKAKYSTVTELSKMEGCVLLFKDGKWHYCVGEDFIPELPILVPTRADNPMRSFDYRTLSDSDEITYLYGQDFKSWAELQVKSDKSGKPIFVFRGNKLIATINHPLNK